MDARLMVSIGFLATSLGLYNMTRLDLNVSFGHIVMWRVFQVLGLSFIFIPISTLNYVGVPKGKNNQISSFSNFARNFGGSMGTALLTTFLVRTQQTHQSSLAANFIPGSVGLREFSRPDQKRLDGCGTDCHPGQGRSHRVRLPAVAAAIVDAELPECLLGAERGGGGAGSLALHHAPPAQAQEAAPPIAVGHLGVLDQPCLSRCRGPGDGSADR